MNIIFIGMRSAGKSNISRRLSVLTKRAVLSTDQLIQYDNDGKTIPEIIEENQGDWRIFRHMEYKVVKKVARLDGNIIDCGGGVTVDIDEQDNEVFSDKKVQLLKNTGPIIWLKGDIARLAAKVKNDQARPTLDNIRSAEEVMRRRLPFYEQAADIIVDIEGKKRTQLVEEIFEIVQKLG